jgi:hypothetical protein
MRRTGIFAAGSLENRQVAAGEDPDAPPFARA